jgi:small subunit ribosomal protein S6
LHKNYELVLVLAPDLKDDQLASMKGQITTEMSNLGAEIVNQDDWGKRELAFEVKDFLQGYYHLYQFTAPADLPGKLKGLLKVNEKVIRYLLTTWEPKAKPAEEAEPGEPVEVVEEVKPGEPVEVVEEVKIADEPAAEAEAEEVEKDTENTE